MVVVKIELWPFGVETDKVLLGAAAIANDGSGDNPDVGNYEATLLGKGGRVWKTVRVEGFPRQKLLAWDLLYRVLRAAGLEERQAGAEFEKSVKRHNGPQPTQ